jgi:fructose-bisphosphate aldolase class 1
MAMFKYMMGGISAARVMSHDETASKETAAPAEKMPKITPGVNSLSGG